MEQMVIPIVRLRSRAPVLSCTEAFRLNEQSSENPAVEMWLGSMLTMRQLEAIGALIHQVWPRPGCTAEDRAVQLAEMIDYSCRDTGCDARIYVVRQGDSVIAQAVVLPRLITWAGKDMLVGGLSRVGAHPLARGYGHGQSVVRAAMMLADRRAVSCLLFQTSLKVRPFYLELGAGDVRNTIINSLAHDLTESPFHDELVMRYPAGDDAGVIDLRGLGY